MNEKNKELAVGLFVLAGIICSVWLFVSLGGADFGKNKQMKLFAYFSSVSGLKKGATVEMAGVKIGKVNTIELDTMRYAAKVELLINKDLQLSEDSIASVKTAGIIGDKYINISAGGSETLLMENDIMYNTESSLDIESLVSKYIFSQKKE